MQNNLKEIKIQNNACHILINFTHTEFLDFVKEVELLELTENVRTAKKNFSK
jgi:hypothetical protein